MTDKQFDTVFIATHIIYRKTPPHDPLEGPYSSVANALATRYPVTTLQIPIEGFNQPVRLGTWKQERPIQEWPWMGRFAPFKYLFDMIITTWHAMWFLLKRKQFALVIGIDPLCCLPLVYLRKLMDFRLVFYSVDFNKNRFSNGFLQYLYEKADEIATRGSDQTWVVCESLQDYKKKEFGADSVYIPNSSPFDATLYENNKGKKTGNKVSWTGSLLTDRQFDILFGLLKKIEKIRPDLEFYFAPTGKHEKFEEYGKTYQLKTCKVLRLTSRRQWQEFAVTTDVGIAVYDDQFGSTYFIEPLKIWDFLMCGMPFIISTEPSLSTPIKQSGVAYLLGLANTIADEKTLRAFLEPSYLKSKQKTCVELADEYDIGKQMEKAIQYIKK